MVVVSLALTALVSLEPPPAEVVAPSASQASSPQPAVADTVHTEAPPAPPTGGSRLAPPGDAERMAPRKLGGGTFKPMGGLTWRSDDRRYALALSTWGQLLYTFEHASRPPVGLDADTQSFQVRRARLVLSGNAFTEHFKYSVQFHFAPRELGLRGGGVRQSPLFWFFVSYDGFRDVVPQAGLFFVPYSRQRLEAPWKLQLLDRSMVAYEFGFGRDTGLALKSLDFLGLDKLRYHVGVFMGEGYDFAVPRDMGLLYVARVEVLPFGMFDDYAEADFVRSTKPKLSIGAAYAFNDNDISGRSIDVGPADGGTTDTHNVTVDAHFKIAGFSLLGDFFWRRGERTPGDATMVDEMGNEVPVPTEAPRTGLGYTVQAGFMIPRTYLELVGRYAGMHPLGENTSLPRSDEFGPGIGYYFFHHALKLQVDYFRQRLPSDATIDRLRMQLTFAF